MTSLAELGEISKAQSQEKEKRYNQGRLLAAGGAGATLGGLGIATHGAARTLRDADRYLPHDFNPDTEDLGSAIKRGGGPTRARFFGSKKFGPMPRGSHRIGGGTLGVLAGTTALGAAPVVGGINMMRKRRDQERARR